MSDAIIPVPAGIDHFGRHEHDEGHGRAWNAPDLVRVAFVALAAAAVGFHVYEPFSSFSLIGVAATLIGGYPIFREAGASILERRMTMELSMTIALVAALFIREFFTALIITLFVLVAEILEHLTVSRGRKAIDDLLNLLPRTAEVLQDGMVIETLLTDIKPGDRVLVRPGTRIAVDGVLVRGSSFVDQSAITGEPLPVEKMLGHTIYAGSINQTGAIEVQATSVGADTSFGRIVEAVEKAERSRAPVQKLADRLSGYLVYFALAAALVTFLLTLSLPVIITGIGLFRLRPWACVAGIVLSIFGMMMVPFGTIVGAYGLWVLFSKDTERLFTAAAPAGPLG